MPLIGIRVLDLSLHRAGVIGEEPAGGSPPSTVPLARQVELGWIVEQDPYYQQFLEGRS